MLLATKSRQPTLRAMFAPIRGGGGDLGAKASSQPIPGASPDSQGSPQAPKASPREAIKASLL